MPNPSRKSKQKKNQQQINNACLKTKKGMTVFSLIFIAIVRLIYFLEIKWRKKHNKPLNNGRPIDDGGDFMLFWTQGSIIILIVIFAIVSIFQDYYIYSYMIFEYFLRDIYTGYILSEPYILKAYFPKGSPPRDDVELMSAFSLYRLQILIVTVYALIFGRKFVYAPFFEMKKEKRFIVNVLNILSLLFLILLSGFFLYGWAWFAFRTPMFSAVCPARAGSLWCSNLSGAIRPYVNIKFPVLLFFYWMFFLMLINAMIQSLLNELGYVKPEAEETKEETSDLKA